MPKAKRFKAGNARAPTGARIVPYILRAAKGVAASLPKGTRSRSRRNANGSLLSSSSFLTNGSVATTSMPIATGIGRIPRSLGMSDLVDFEISYNPADIVLGGGTSSALGTPGIAYWAPRGPGVTPPMLLTYNFLPVAPCDNYIGRNNMYDVMKHYSRKVVSSVKVYLTPELTNTGNNGLFAISATRGGTDTFGINSTTTATSLSVGTDTDVMTMKNAVPFRVYDSVEYDATWAIAGGSGAKQNEFAISNSDTNNSTVVGNAVDGLGVIPCVLVMGGSAGGAYSTSNQTASHRCIIKMTISLLDYRGTFNALNPLLDPKPVFPKSTPCPFPPPLNPCTLPVDPVIRPDYFGGDAQQSQSLLLAKVAELEKRLTSHT